MQDDHGSGSADDDEPTLVIAGIEEDPGYGMPRAGRAADTGDVLGAPDTGTAGLEWRAGEKPPAEAGELPIPVTAVPAPDSTDGNPVPPAPTGLHPPHVLRRLAFAVAAAVLLLGTVTVAALGNGDDSGTATPVAQPSAGRWASPSGPSDHVVSRPLDGRTESALDLVSAASAVTVRSAALGGELYRISTPAGGVRPQATDAGGRIRLALDGRGAGGGGGTGGNGDGGPVVDIVLNERVRWDLSVAGGAEQHRIDLAGSRLRRVDLAGGSGRIVLTLPRPEGTLVVRMAGGVRDFAVHTAGAAPVRVRVGSGAGRVVLGGRTHAGVAAGALFTPERWDDAGDRIDLDAAAGLSQLTVDGT